jgi:hypothetical protein
MGGILELIKLIYGSKALSKVLGTRTNVIRLPDNELKQYTKSELNIEAASNKLAQKAKADMFELLGDYPRMNDAEKLIFEGNLRRLGNKLEVVQKKQGPAADVLEFGTGEKVSPEGIMSLTEKAGQKNPPTTLMGKLESRIKQLEASGEDLSKMKGQTLDEIMGDVASSQQGMRQLEKQGLVRATARDIITTDIKSGKLKLPKELEQQILEGGGEPIDVLRNVYGEDALEVLDSLIPEFSKLRTSTEAEKLARSKFKFEPDVNRPKGSMSLEEAKKAKQENILTPGKAISADSPEGKKITEALIGKPKAEVVSLPTAEKILSDMRNLGPIDAMKEANKVLKREGPYKNLTDKDIEKIMDDINDHIFGGDLPVDPEDFATGGRVGYMGGGSTGLDYLMGIDRKNYQQGSAPVDELIINLINSGDSTPSPSTTTSTPSSFQPTMMDMIGFIASPVLGAANLASRTKTGLSLAEKAMDAMGIGRGPGGRTEGYGVDSVAGMASGPTHGVDDVNSQSVGADASAGGAAGAAAASAAGANDGPDTGGSFAQGGIVNRTGFKFGTKFGRFWKIARKVWDDINPTGDRKYDAQLVADELAEQIFKTSMDDLPQNAQIDLYALAYNNAPKVDALFRNPQSLSEAAKKGMAASKEMESLGLDVSKNSDFFKYEEMKLSGQLGPEHQVQAYKDKIRDEFYGVIDDTLMKQVEVDDNPQRLAEVYASIKEGLEMQRKGMTPEEIIRVMKQTPRTKNSQGGLNYLMGY